MNDELKNIDLTIAQRKEITKLLKLYLPNTEVWAYGSRVKFTSKPSSDLDMVAFASSAQKMAVYDLKEAFEESDLPFRVDLFIWDEVPEQFHKNIKSDRVVLQGVVEERVVGGGWNFVDFRELYKEPSRNGLTKPSKIRGEGTKFVNMKEIFAYDRMLNIDCERVPLTERETQSSLLEPLDLLFARQSLVLEGAGKCSIYLGDAEPAAFESHLIRVRIDQESADPYFLYYFFKSPQGHGCIYAIAEQGAGASGIRGSDLGGIPVPLPPLPEQKAIAHILGSLDDKIELNRRMNATLEGMAQALFKSWFVDFDPVIDNILANNLAKYPSPSLSQGERDAVEDEEGSSSAGRSGNEGSIYDGIPEELAERAKVRRKALADGTANREAAKQFPAAFQITEEMGWIPEGWGTEQLGNYLDVLETGRRPKGGVSKYTSGVPSVGAESIFGIGQFDYGKLKFVPEEFFEKMKSGKVESYDVLLYKDGGKPGEFKPRSGMFGEGFPFESFGINEHVFRMRSSTIGQAFLYYQVSSERVFHHLAVRGGKAAIPGINQQEVKSVDFLIPSEEAIKSFNDFCQTIFEKILKSASKSKRLVNLRDTLLPKLISGELRVPHAKKMIKDEL